MKSRRIGRIGVVALVCGAAFVACRSPAGLDFDARVFDAIPELEALDWAAVQPAAAWDYWELRFAGLSHNPVVVGAGGALAREELGAAALAALDAADPEAGFSSSCLPAYCYRYVVALDGDAATVIATADGLRAFLAPVTTREEAILLVSARPLISWDDGAETGIRAVDGGWDVVVFELVRDCVPVQTDRVLFRVGAAGHVLERGREMWSRVEGACV